MTVGTGVRWRFAGCLRSTGSLAVAAATLRNRLSSQSPAG
jgi:hypothetical protein